MAQYEREWDQGKDWNEDGYRVNVRGRDDDDFYGEGKRRKFNNGGYDDSQIPYYDEGNSRNYTHGYQEQWQDQSFEERPQRGGFPARKRHVASEPSPHVIFLGLDMDFTEADLFNYLKGHGCVLETVTIIRDRNTGLSKGFGFAQFKTTEQAQSFVDPNFPFVSVPPPASHGASATAAFHKAMETGAQHDGRRVKIDYSQSVNPPDKGRLRGPQFTNDGTRDIGNTQAAVLLFRGLDPLSGPAAVAQAMKASSGPGKNGAKGMKRILLIKDKVTMASWGFVFVEFVDLQSASTVLAATMSAQLHPNGFRISDRPVAASFAHPYSFQPLPEHALPDETCVPSSVSLGGVDGSWVKYWDEASSLAVMEFEVEEPVQPQTSGPAKEKKEKKKPKAPSAEDASAPAVAFALPVSMKPVTLSFNKAGANAGKPNVVVTAPMVSKAALGFATLDDPDAPNNEDESGNQVLTAEDTKAKSAQKAPPLIVSKKVVSNITKWSQVQEELKQNVPSTATQAAPAASVPVAARSAPAPPETEYEYSDVKAMTCLLCSRQFKTLDQLKRHNKESDLHKKNVKNANLRDIAREKANAARQQAQAVDQTNKYRDRASERRTLHNQPDVPMPEQKSGNRRHSEGPPPPPSPPPAPPIPAKDENNVGNKLLKMMGWTEGTGLGTSGEGRVEPIQTAIYASGAGLGASKGKEIGKYTEGYAGYVHMAKDAARERYGD